MSAADGHGDGKRRRNKVFLFGGSYGGMLVAWHRLKYPHLSDGGVVSSGPIDFYLAQDTE